MNASLYSGHQLRQRIKELESKEHVIILVDEGLLFELIYFSALGEIDKPVYEERGEKYRVLIDRESIERLKPFVRIDFPKDRDERERKAPCLSVQKN